MSRRNVVLGLSLCLGSAGLLYLGNSRGLFGTLGPPSAGHGSSVGDLLPSGGSALVGVGDVGGRLASGAPSPQQAGAPGPGGSMRWRELWERAPGLVEELTQVGEDEAGAFDFLFGVMPEDSDEAFEWVVDRFHLEGVERSRIEEAIDAVEEYNWELRSIRDNYVSQIGQARTELFESGEFEVMSPDGESFGGGCPQGDVLDLNHSMQAGWQGSIAVTAERFPVLAATKEDGHRLEQQRDTQLLRRLR